MEDAYLARHSLTSDALEFLLAASNAGVAVWCLSNDVARWSTKLRNVFGLDDLLAGAVISSDARVRKPDVSGDAPGVYRLVPRAAFAWLERNFPESATRFSFTAK